MEGWVSSLLPPNATIVERAIEGAIAARLDAIETPLRKLWDPNTCPANLLPWLAWALSIDSWKAYWPEHIKRERIRSALNIQRRKGTALSVHDVVAAFGGSIAIREWWQQHPPGEPHTFAVVLTLSGESGQAATAEFTDDVIAEIERTKPVRSHFTFTQGLVATGGVGIGAAARLAVYRRMQLEAIEQ
jgi:phage tail P2-like protein